MAAELENRIPVGRLVDAKQEPDGYTLVFAPDQTVMWPPIVPFLLGGKVDFAWSGGVHNRYLDGMTVLLGMTSDLLLATPDVPLMKEDTASRCWRARPSGRPRACRRTCAPG